MTTGKGRGCSIVLLFVLSATAIGWSQTVNSSRYIMTEALDEAATPGTPQYTRAIGLRLQSPALRKIEDFLRTDGFSSQGVRTCFRNPADCYREVEVCLNYDIKFNNRTDLRFRPDVGANGALEVNLAIKRPNNSSPPFDLTSVDVHLRNPSGTFSWCSLNPLRNFTNGRLKFSENGSTPGLTVNLLLEPVVQGGSLTVRKVGGSGVRINQLFLQFSGWPDWLINWVFNLGFIRNSVANLIEAQTISAINGYLRDLLRFEGGFEGFSYNFTGSRAKIDGNGLNLYFNGGINYLGVEDDCTNGRAPWPSEPGTDPVSTIESFQPAKDAGVAIRTVLANNALREAYNRGVFCYKNDAAPFHVGDFCSMVPDLCLLFDPQQEAYFDMKLLPDPSDPAQLPRIEITQPGPDGKLTVRFNNLYLAGYLRDRETGEWGKLLCLSLDASVDATVAFAGSAVYLRVGSGNTQIDGYSGALLPKDIDACTGGIDIEELLPAEDIQRLIREFLIPYFNNTVGQVPFSTNIFTFGCYRVYANGYGLGGEYTNIYASLLKARDLPSCGAPGGRTTVDIFNGPAEGSHTNSRRPSFWTRAADPRGEAACVDMRYASGFDGPLSGYVPASGCPLGIYTVSPSADLPDGPHLFRVQAKTLAVRPDACLPGGRPECESTVVERRFFVDTAPPSAPDVFCPREAAGAAVAIQWSAAVDEMTPPEEMRYQWFLQNLGNGRSRQSSLLDGAARNVTLSAESNGRGGPTLLPHTTYEFWVRAVDKAGNSSVESNRCRFTTP